MTELIINYFIPIAIIIAIIILVKTVKNLNNLLNK